METIVKARKTAKVRKEESANSSSSNTALVKKKGRLTDYWEKYPEGLLTIVDRRAILK